MLVVSDTGPINYLVLIGHANILPILFGSVILPAAVLTELSSPDAPSVVLKWVSHRPNWIEVRHVSTVSNGGLPVSLDEGEREVITLAEALPSELLLLMDDRAAVLVARRRGLAITGTLGVLELAARRGLLNLPEAFKRLRQTNFHCPEEIMTNLLRERQREDDWTLG